MKMKKVLSLLLTLLLCCSMLTVFAVEEETPIYLDPSRSTEERVADLLSRMTVDEKIRQTVQAELGYAKPNTPVNNPYMKANAYGSVLNGGGSPPATVFNPDIWFNNINNFQKDASETRLGIPIIYGVDAVHGFNGFVGATVFPHNVGLGCTNNVDLMREIGRITAIECGEMGYFWTFAPCTADPQNIRWGRTYEGLSSDVDIVSPMIGAVVEGLQGTTKEGYADRHAIAATAKHLGLEGWTVNGANAGNVILPDDYMTNEAYINDVLLPALAPYQAAIDAGVMSIMPSFSSINGLKCHENPFLLTELLRNRMGFKGFYVGDWSGHTSTSGTFMYPVAEYPELNANSTMQRHRRHIACFNAGLDLFMNGSSGQPAQVVQALQYGYDNGYITDERLDEAVGLMLTVKFDLGLFDDNRFLEDYDIDVIGSEEHRAVARQAVRESLVLLKNDNDIINQLADMDKIFVAGQHADSLLLQAGGWTVSWQSAPGTWTGSQFGTTILEGFRKNSEAEFVYDRTGLGSEGCQAAVVVVGEQPYAEGNGDATRTGTGARSLYLSAADQAVFNNIKAENPDIPVIFILISGRPMMVTDYIDQSDAFIAAWLPGTEGDGIGEVLFKDEYDFTGRLAMDWPASGWVGTTGNESPSLNNNPTLGTDPSKYLDLLYVIGDGMSADTSTQISAPESAVVSEEFSFTAKLSGKYTGIKLVNETGKAVGLGKVTVATSSNVNTWTATTSVGTVGQGRTFTVLAKTLSGGYEEVGTFTIDITLPAGNTQLAVLRSAEFSASHVSVNQPFELLARTDAAATGVVTYNEKGGKIGTKLLAKQVVGSSIIWTYEMSVGTAGQRVLSNAAINRYGIVNADAPILVPITVVK